MSNDSEISPSGLPAQNFGLPTMNIDEMSGIALPTEYEVVSTMGDIIMGYYIDENQHGEVLRDGIYLKLDVTQKVWRIVKVMKTGPTVRYVKVDDLVMIPGDKGLKMINFGGQKCVFFNEERIFAVVKPREITK